MSNIIKKETISALDKAAKSGIDAVSIVNKFERTFALAEATNALVSLLTPEAMQPIMALQGKTIGFKTDKEYPINIVKDCIISAVLNGVYPVGNEFNIISGQCYITKEGFGRKLNDVNGLSWLITPGIPKTMDKGAIIEMTVEWTYNKVSKSKTIPIAVRVNNFMGTDAIIGKAERKARAWLYRAVTGQEVCEGDVDDCDIINITPNKSKFESTNKNDNNDDFLEVKATNISLAEILEKSPISIQDVKDYCVANKKSYNEQAIIDGGNITRLINDVLNWKDSK